MLALLRWPLSRTLLLCALHALLLLGPLGLGLLTLLILLRPLSLGLLTLLLRALSTGLSLGFRTILLRALSTGLSLGFRTLLLRALSTGLGLGFRTMLLRALCPGLSYSAVCGKCAPVNPIHCSCCRAPMIYVCKLGTVMPRSILVGYLVRRWLNVVFAHSHPLPGIRLAINAAGPIKAVMAAVTIIIIIYVGVMYKCTVYVPGSRVVHETSACPATAIKTHAAITPAVVNTAVETNT